MQAQERSPPGRVSRPGIVRRAFRNSGSGPPLCRCAWGHRGRRRGGGAAQVRAVRGAVPDQSASRRGTIRPATHLCGRPWRPGKTRCPASGTVDVAPVGDATAPALPPGAHRHRRCRPRARPCALPVKNSAPPQATASSSARAVSTSAAAPRLRSRRRRLACTLSGHRDRRRGPQRRPWQSRLQHRNGRETRPRGQTATERSRDCRRSHQRRRIWS